MLNTLYALNTVEDLNKLEDDIDKDIILLSACMFGKLDILKYLVDDLKMDIHYENDYPLYCALLNGNIEIATYLLSRGAIMVDIQEHLKYAEKENIELYNFIKGVIDGR